MHAAIYSFTHGQALAADLAAAMRLKHELIESHTFPDGESRVRIPSAANTAFIYCPLDRPNEKLAELMFAADAFRRGNTRRLVLVAPYLCYMRQDKSFREGEAVSQQAVARFLSSLFDRILTVDAHLHRVSSIGEVFPEIEAANLPAEEAIAHFALEQGFGKDTVVAGPDEESAQWVGRLAEALGARSVTARKIRRGDREVEISFPVDPDVARKRVLIVDDIVSSGGTMLSALATMRERGAASIHVVVTHALFDEELHRRMQMAGASNVWSTTSVPHPTNAISLAELLAEALRDELKD
ncbi:MAG: ribose-phosphate diphosphokinase [Parvibaculum sp.]|nr:ribose-phosphate diphosphokinase [Parvibaculum sp.]MBO6678819.1 ribose-phosphate diphosphokinase [Parvibaculum sp.]MBO6686776.1 ribose-phosphate diphosphokinase [Parvibaculum sp.]MBO6903974.1 ribose-phosphate diphosphokinase [Parvibaculum sp.]